MSSAASAEVDGPVELVEFALAVALGGVSVDVADGVLAGGVFGVGAGFPGPLDAAAGCDACPAFPCTGPVSCWATKLTVNTIAKTKLPKTIRVIAEFIDSVFALLL